MEIVLIIIAAVIGRWLARILKQPTVLGELVAGIIIGNIGFWFDMPIFTLIMELSNVEEIFRVICSSGISVAEGVRHVYSPTQLTDGEIGNQLLAILTGTHAPRYIIMGFTLWLFSGLGIIILLFMVGLDTSIADMKNVGRQATMVALFGVAIPLILGIVISYWILLESSISFRLFLGATLSATSIGITARLFKDLNQIQDKTVQIILGAAVIDDIIGLILLAIVVAIATAGELDLLLILRISILSIMFLGAVFFFGERLVRWTLVNRFDQKNQKLLYSICLAFTLSLVANLIGLSSIVGAFAAGLILSESYFTKSSSDKATIKDLIAPLEAVFTPIFFVLMGMQVNLTTFLMEDAIWLSLSITAVAILGKLLSGIFAGRQNDRLSIGIGMVPRGEVGLIFAIIGKSLGVFSNTIFSAVVFMVIVTTLITPVLLKWSVNRNPSASIG
ncbi:MAG: sodium:proton antiporter [Thermodesulfobacteriota bacterium]|nr:MAG: sodium:proton antiporter [Thermodesulfobacteriota bacterium]